MGDVKIKQYDVEGPILQDIPQMESIIKTHGDHNTFQAGAGAEDILKWTRLLDGRANLKESDSPGPPKPLSKLLAKRIMKEKYDIEFIERFKISALRTGTQKTTGDVYRDIMAARDNPTDPNDPRPVAVLIYPKTDWNHAFEDMTLNHFFKLGYKLLYYEANDEVQAERALIEATGGGRKRANVIILGGHGTSRSLQLGRGRGEKYEIDTKDFRGNKPDINLPRYISQDGDLILESCSNGKGGRHNKTNLANTIAGYMPRGVTIHAATRPTSIDEITRNASGRLVVEYYGRHSTYTTTGTAESVITESELAVLEERHSRQVTALEYIIKDLMNRKSEKEETSWFRGTVDLVDAFNSHLNSRMNQRQYMAAKHELMRLATKYKEEKFATICAENGIRFGTQSNTGEKSSCGEISGDILATAHL